MGSTTEVEAIGSCCNKGDRPEPADPPRLKDISPSSKDCSWALPLRLLPPPPVRIPEVEAPEEERGRPDRVTREEVHADTLRALYRQEPRLERAVEELDLELME